MMVKVKFVNSVKPQVYRLKGNGVLFTTIHSDRKATLTKKKIIKSINIVATKNELN